MGAWAAGVQHVFVIAMENHDSVEIYGDMTDAPYINGTLLAMGAHATNFTDELPIPIPSEPHYVWMEAATNTFSDVTFTTDSDPSASNSTSSTSHLATQITASGTVTWRTYQEGLDATTGTCPIHSSNFYAAKHDPFVFFQDLTGNPPSATSATCTAHHKAYSTFADDLTSGDVASYTFITPNLCNDMHGATGCPNSNLIASGDMWLSAELPRILAYASAHVGVVFLAWDEGDTTGKMPFVALGPTVKAGYAGSVTYSHSSLVEIDRGDLWLAAALDSRERERPVRSAYGVPLRSAQQRGTSSAQPRRGRKTKRGFRGQREGSGHICRREKLGGLLNFYERKAA